jgi:hypothetical protein
VKQIELIVLNALRNLPNSTALELFEFIKNACQDREDRAFLRDKSALFNEDQAVREILAKLEKAKLVTHVIRSGTISKEWVVL